MLDEISEKTYQRWRVFYEVKAEEAEQEHEEAMQAARQRRR